MKLVEKSPHENARMYAHRMILDNIINLELPPGSALSENELSLLLKLSRTPVREALIELSQLGLVEIIPQKGSFVTRIDYDVIEESKFMRLSLENSVLRLLCQQGTSEDHMNRIRQSMNQQKQEAKACTDYMIMMTLEKRDWELAEMVMTRHLTRHEIDKKELDQYCPDYFTKIETM